MSFLRNNSPLKPGLDQTLVFHNLKYKLIGNDT